MYAIDLFCGAGGFSEGILQAGFHIVFSSDKSPYVQETYMNRHEQLGLIQGENTHFELADIQELNGEDILNKINSLKHFKNNNEILEQGDIDAIFGGPPCQGFSIAGKRDKSDPRNMLFREYLRVIKDIEPKYIVMENVTGFMSMQVNPDFKSFHGFEYSDKELVSEVIRRELEGFGYNVLPSRILDASDYGVPQKRLRAIFLAYKKGETPLYYPEPTTLNDMDKLTVEQALTGVSMESNKKAYSLSSSSGRTPNFLTGQPIGNNGEHYNMEESKHSRIIQERFSLFEQGESVNNLKVRLKNRKISGNIVLNLEEYPNLLRETVFNINKQFNLSFLSDELIQLGISFTDSFVNSLYKKIIKLWSLNVDSRVFLTEVKKPIGKLTVDSNIFVGIFLKARECLNTSITEQDLKQWFLNTPPQLFDDGIPDTIVLGNKNVKWEDIWNALLTNKNTRTRLDKTRPGPTMLTLPDDFIHPTINKILNVREMARIQSFDDSFQFLGKRTTGGEKRTEEVPQFTQVGNAVPPLMAAAIAKKVASAINGITEE